MSDAVWNNIIQGIVAIALAWIAYKQHTMQGHVNDHADKLEEVASVVKTVSDQVQAVHETIMPVVDSIAKS